MARIEARGKASAWECVVKAMCIGHNVRFQRLRDVASAPCKSEITPDLLIPWRGGWYVIGEGRVGKDSRRQLMVNLDEMAEAIIVEKRAYQEARQQAHQMRQLRQIARVDGAPERTESAPRKAPHSGRHALKGPCVRCQNLGITKENTNDGN